jgi:periplasmic protein CpxP/Spy
MLSLYYKVLCIALKSQWESFQTNFPSPPSKERGTPNHYLEGVLQEMYSGKSLIMILGIMLAFGTVVVAQQTQTQSEAGQLKRGLERFPARGERRGRREGMGHRGGVGHLIRELNLTDEQRQQARAIMQQRLAGTKEQREELFKLREKRIAGTFTTDDEVRAKALRQEMRASMEGVRAEMEGVLTAEQRTKLEQLKQERKAKFEQRMKERQEFQNKKQQ